MSWRWEFGFLMLGVSMINFYAAQQVAKEKNKGWWMLLTSVVSMLPLIYYKYGNFFITSINDCSSFFGQEGNIPALKVILPVGISFFTFQALSYSIDVYQKKIEAENSLVKFLTFVAFFPQLVAGPIERSTNILPQFDEVKKFKLDLAISGSKIFIWGLFKKVVIADRLGLYADPVFNNPDAWSSPTLALAALFFTIQIYCDFSGYSDMAVGIARIMGFKLMQNFNLPYLAHSIGDFWKRWHISLSTWFGDYLYIPLGGNRVSVPRWFVNIFIVFIVSGFWHGANWTFIAWGALHGIYYLIEYLGKVSLKTINLGQIITNKYYKAIKIPIVFIMVVYAWIFFRANNITDAFAISHKLFNWEGSLWWGSSSVTSILSLLLIAFLFIVQIFQHIGIVGIYDRPSKLPGWMSFIGFLLLLLGVSLLGVSSNAFIYFQF
jgi:alginate O-acetyltransferase complex protein AlgI